MIVAGCVAQAENQEMLKREPYIDIVIGPQSYHKINETLKKFIPDTKKEETDFDTILKFDYLMERSRIFWSSCIRHNTKMAKLIATFLYS